MPKHLFFALAVLAQVVILAVKPTEKLVIRHVTGRVVTLATVPVDPYDIMRGYYMTLRYEISQPPSTPSWSVEKRGATVYTLIEMGSDGEWRPVSVHRELPVGLSINQAVIRGRVVTSWRGSMIEYGIEQYFVPEEMRSEIEQQIRGAGGRIHVDVAVDSQGRSSILRLHVGGKTYEY